LEFLNSPQLLCVHYINVLLKIIGILKIFYHSEALSMSLVAGSRLHPPDYHYPDYNVRVKMAGSLEEILGRFLETWLSS